MAEQSETPKEKTPPGLQIDIKISWKFGNGELQMLYAESAFDEHADPAHVAEVAPRVLPRLVADAVSAFRTR